MLHANVPRVFFLFLRFLLTNAFLFGIISFASAAMAQLVERVLGKDEVGSSNLPSSSKKAGPALGNRLFYFTFS